MAELSPSEWLAHYGRRRGGRTLDGAAGVTKERQVTAGSAPRKFLSKSPCKRWRIQAYRSRHRTDRMRIGSTRESTENARTRGAKAGGAIWAHRTRARHRSITDSLAHRRWRALFRVDNGRAHPHPQQPLSLLLRLGNSANNSRNPPSTYRRSPRNINQQATANPSIFSNMHQPRNRKLASVSRNSREPPLRFRSFEEKRQEALRLSSFVWSTKFARCRKHCSCDKPANGLLVYCRARLNISSLQ